MASPKKKTMAPVVVDKGVEVAEVTVPVTVHTGDHPSHDSNAEKPARPSRQRRTSTSRPEPPKDSAAQKKTKSPKPASRRKPTAKASPPPADTNKTPQVAEARGEIDALRSEIHALRRQWKDASQQLSAFQHEAEQARKGQAAVIKASSALLDNLKALLNQVSDAGRIFREAGRQVEAGLNPLGEHLRESAPLLEALPERASQALERLEAVAEELPGLEKQAESARARLFQIRQQTTEAEMRLAVLTQETRESEARLLNAREQVTRLKHDSDEPHVNGKPPRERLGLTIGPGVVVREVTPDSPAANAGLFAGDVLRTVNGAPVGSGEQVQLLVSRSVGGQIALGVVRGGKHLPTTAVLPEPDADESQRHELGLRIGPGVLVDAVEPNSPAEGVGIAPGDVITAVNAESLHSGEELRQMVLLHAEGGEAAGDLILSLYRGDRLMEFRLPVTTLAHA